MRATRRGGRRLLGDILFGLGAVAAVAFAPVASASSHREAPFIARMPAVDATDFYMFRSYAPGRSAFVTLIANYIPFQDPPNGPNFAMFDPNAVYEIHIDNNGNGAEDITFQFRFASTNKDTTLPVGGQNVSIPLINSGLISGVNPATLNVRETYSVRVVTGNRRSGTAANVTNAAGGSTTFDKPVDNIGNKSIADYAAYAAQHIYDVNIPNCATPGRVFAGQRRESFVVNVGEIFDLLNIPAAVVTGMQSAKKNDLEMKNISTLALEVPIACLTQGTETVIGAWTTASVRQARLINPFTGATTTPSKEGGPFAQVSRLGMPLVNEVVIGLKDKDRFNASRPSGDGQFLTYVTNPVLPALIQALYGVTAPTKFPRSDLVATFLTGISGLNQPANVQASEMLRLNTTFAPVAKGLQKRLGVLEGDTAGFPNGRRPGDDVVDIALRVVMGVLCTLNVPATYGCAPGDAPSGAIPFTDGAFTDDQRFDATFPYLSTPLPGSPQP